MGRRASSSQEFIPALLKTILLCTLTVVIAYAVSSRTVSLSRLDGTTASLNDVSKRLSFVESKIEELKTSIEQTQPAETVLKTKYASLYQKKIVYDGDSIAESRADNGGGYPALVAEITGGSYVNLACGGARLCSYENRHSVVENLKNLPRDGDLYCFEGGINDFWSNIPIGTYDPADYSGPLDTKTVCGALETIFRHCLETFPGKPVCFVIVHKIQNTATAYNGIGKSFNDYRTAMIEICRKYSIPYYDAFSESGLNGWNKTQNNLFLTANNQGLSDGIHPNREGYRRYYVPQLIDLFSKIMPID